MSNENEAIATGKENNNIENRIKSKSKKRLPKSDFDSKFAGRLALEKDQVKHKSLNLHHESDNHFPQ